jgi:hypothetical protein
MNYKTFLFYIILVSIALIPGFSGAQILLPVRLVQINQLPRFNEIDSIYVFVRKQKVQRLLYYGQIQVWKAQKLFNWEKYNPVSAAFEFYFSESTGEQRSEISDLADGCYRVTITQGENTSVHRAWVFNNWFTAAASITESNCEWFKLQGEYATGELKYYDWQITLN